MLKEWSNIENKRSDHDTQKEIFNHCMLNCLLIKKIAVNEIIRNRQSIATHHVGASGQQVVAHALAKNKNGVAIQ